MELIRSSKYKKWFEGLKDNRAQHKIRMRIKRLLLGNPGDVGPVGDGISELRIDYGQGYRVYYKDTGKEIIILLCGGSTKKTQQTDIEEAKKLLKKYNEGESI